LFFLIKLKSLKVINVTHLKVEIIEDKIKIRLKIIYDEVARFIPKQTLKSIRIYPQRQFLIKLKEVFFSTFHKNDKIRQEITCIARKITTTTNFPHAWELMPPKQLNTEL